MDIATIGSSFHNIMKEKVIRVKPNTENVLGGHVNT